MGVPLRDVHRPMGEPGKVSGMRIIQFTKKGISKGNRDSRFLTCLLMTIVFSIASFYPIFTSTVWCGLPQNTYLGFGTAKFGLTSDHPAIDSANGNGYQFIFGRYSAPSFSGEIVMSGGLRISTGAVPSPYYPEDSAEYGYFMFGGRYHFIDLSQKNISPWIGLAWGWHNIMWDTYFYEISGTSLTPYAGVDILLGDRGGLLRAEVKRHSFSASSGWYGGNYHVDVNEFNISLGYLFR